VRCQRPPVSQGGTSFRGAALFLSFAVLNLQIFYGGVAFFVFDDMIMSVKQKLHP